MNKHWGKNDGEGLHWTDQKVSVPSFIAFIESIFAKETKGRGRELSPCPFFTLVQTPVTCNMCDIEITLAVYTIFQELLYLHKKLTLLQGSNNTGS